MRLSHSLAVPKTWLQDQKLRRQGGRAPGGGPATCPRALRRSLHGCFARSLGSGDKIHPCTG